MISIISIFLPAGHALCVCPADTKIVLRSHVYVFVLVRVCVCSSAIITCAKLHHSVTNTTIATSAVEATGSLQAK